MKYCTPSWWHRWRPLLVFLAIGLAIGGQRLLDGRSYWQLGVGLYGLALLVFLLGTGGERPRPQPVDSPLPSLIRRHQIRWLLACLALLLGVITFMTAGENRFRWYTVAAWAGACGGWFLAFAERPFIASANRQWLTADGLSVNLKWRHLALLAILLLAAWFRFYRLEDVPREMTIDHPHKLLDVRDLLQGQYRVFFPRNSGRELFQFYYTASLVRMFNLGLTHDTLKLGTALASFATVVTTYLLAREIFGTETALVTIAFLAISRWDLGISRMGLRFPLAPLALTLMFLFLLRSLRTGRRNDALCCGLVLGLGLYGYSSFRVAPGLVVVVVLLKVLVDREGVRQIGQRRFWTNAALIPTLAVLAFVPLGRYMLDNPDMFWYRVLTRASDLERQLPANPASVFLGNVVNSLLAFNWRGDVGRVHLEQRLPFLDPISGALLILGVGATAWWLLRYRDWRSACFLLGLPVLLLPSSLNLAFPIENPSTNRSSMAIPLVFTLVGLAPGLLLRTTWGRANRLNRMAIVLCLALIISVAGYMNFQSYFTGYATQYNTYAWNASELARVIRGFVTTCGSLDQAYIAPWPLVVDGRAVAFELGDWEWYNLLDDLSMLPAQAAQPGNKLYLVHLTDQGSLKQLRETYPQAQVRPYRSKTPGHDFWIVFVPEVEQ